MIQNYKKCILIIIIFFNIYIKIYYINKIKIINLLKGRKYLDICLQCINERIFYLKKKPKISVIIPIYNCQNSIKYTIASIQNQILSDYEIILINDYSKDNSEMIIENIRKKDSRIIIINNNKNMGTLYSRNIGVLTARGKYIFPLDNDDLLFNPKIFGLLFKEGINKNYDIIGFKVIYGLNYYSKVERMFDEPFIKNKNDNIVYQPKLKFLSIKNKDYHIWGKLIKKEIYKYAINLMGKKRYSVYLCFGEDDVILFLLFSSSKSYKFYPVYGLFHLKSNKTASFTLSKNHKFFSRIYLLDIIFDFTENNFKEKRFVSSFAILLSKKIHSRVALNNKEYLIKVLQKILNCDYIKIKQKNKIIDAFKKLRIF